MKQGTWEPKINALNTGMEVELFTPSIRINMKKVPLTKADNTQPSTVQKTSESQT